MLIMDPRAPCAWSDPLGAHAGASAHRLVGALEEATLLKGVGAGVRGWGTVTPHADATSTAAATPTAATV